MRHGDYVLTYRYTNASLEIALSTGETQAYKIDICKMLRMSLGRPWSLDGIEYEMIDVADENGELTILLENSGLMTALTFSLSDDGTLNAEAEWKNTSDATLRDVSVGIAIPVDKADAGRLMIPSVCYDDGFAENGDFKCVYLQGGGFIAEEHRLPIPFVSVTNPKRSERNTLALISLPSKCAANASFDSEWSLGIIQENATVELVMLSGGIMTRGVKDCVYSGSSGVSEYERGYFDLEPGMSIKKRFMLYSCEAPKDNDEIAAVIKKSDEIFNPENKLRISYSDLIKYKSVALKNRFMESDDFAGYIKTLSHGQEDVHYTTLADGWTIDNIAAAWCDASNSLQLRMREGITRARQCVDFYIDSSKCKKRGLRQLYFNISDMSWQYSKEGDVVPSFEFGLMASHLADVILLFKDHCLDVPETWIEALEDSCDFLCMMRKMTKAGTYPKYWMADGSMGEFDDTALGVTCVSALAKQYSITGDHEYITVAVKALLKYYDSIVLHNKFALKRKNALPKEVNCDKASYVYFITAAVDCYNVTHDDKLLRMAAHAAQILLTYVNFTDRGVKKDSKFGRHNFDTRGLSVVSKNSPALDVVFPSYELKLIGDITGNAMLKQMADVTLNAAVQLVSTGVGEYGIHAAGEQPEMFYATNWSENGDPEEWRGGYSEQNTLRSLVWSFRQVFRMANVSVF